MKMRVKRLLAGAVLMSAMLIASAPADAATRGGHGGGFHGGHGFRTGFHHGPGFHHGFRPGFHRFGCCFGPAFVGGVLVGSALALPYYAYPYYPSAYPAYAAPVYASAPAYQTQAYAPPSGPPEVCYVGGCYHLQGDGVTVAYEWVWVPSAPPPPPGPPSY